MTYEARQVLTRRLTSLVKSGHICILSSTLSFQVTSNTSNYVKIASYGVKSCTEWIILAEIGTFLCRFRAFLHRLEYFCKEWNIFSITGISQHRTESYYKERLSLFKFIWVLKAFHDVQSYTIFKSLRLYLSLFKSCTEGEGRRRRPLREFLII